LPFPGQELLDLAAAADEPIAVAPDRVGGVGQGDANGIARVPGVLRGTHLGQCRLMREWGPNGNRHRGSSIYLLSEAWDRVRTRGGPARRIDSHGQRLPTAVSKGSAHERAATNLPVLGKSTSVWATVLK